MTKRMNTIRLLTVFVALICLFCFITSALASGFDKSHDCIGDSCMICLCISLREHIFSALLIFAALSVICGIMPIFTDVPVISAKSVFTVATPVCLKVKLSD